MQNLDVMLKKVLSKEEKAIIKIYQLLNREILYKGYKVTEIELEVITRFFADNGDEEIFDLIWTEKSLQREIFKTLLLIAENLKNYGCDKEKIEKDIYNEKNQFLKPSIKNNLNYLMEIGEYLRCKELLKACENYFSPYKAENI